MKVTPSASSASCAGLRLRRASGGVESLVSQPFSMTHASIPLEKRPANGITPQLIRLSVGIEDPHDLIADWQQALRAE